MFREQVNLDDCAVIWENESVIGDELENEKKVLAITFLAVCFVSTGNYVGWLVSRLVGWSLARWVPPSVHLKSVSFLSPF